MDPHSFFANPDPPVFKNKDTVNANRIQLKKLRTKLSYEDFTVVEKTKNKMLKSKNHVSWTNFTYCLIKFQLFPIILDFSCCYFPHGSGSESRREMNADPEPQP